jgi:hypothetical protein
MDTLTLDHLPRGYKYGPENASLVLTRVPAMLWLNQGSSILDFQEHNLLLQTNSALLILIVMVVIVTAPGYQVSAVHQTLNGQLNVISKCHNATWGIINRIFQMK